MSYNETNGLIDRTRWDETGIIDILYISRPQVQKWDIELLKRYAPLLEVAKIELEKRQPKEKIMENKTQEELLLTDEEIIEEITENRNTLDLPKDVHPAENTVTVARNIAKAQLKKIVEFIGGVFSEAKWEALKKEIEDE